MLLVMLGLITSLATGETVPEWNRQPTSQQQGYCSVFYTQPPKDCRPLPDTFIENVKDDSEPLIAGPDVLEDAFEALEVLQDEFFDADFGTWPSAIDWTGAVVETIVCGMLTTLTKSLDNATQGMDTRGWTAKENLISSYFAEIVNSYYGQDILSLRGEAFDDMLWVVLGWIEAITFVREHANRHYFQNDATSVHRLPSRLQTALENEPWHGKKWVPSFAHRSRIFWKLASRGWDTTLCEGGMVWDHRLRPYKNAITNELWISASISMYQFYPGDNITSPWKVENSYHEKDPAHLEAAIEGYRWLMNVNMMNEAGLFVDGYHISSHRRNAPCDIRNEVVYTYNQGVLLTGQRGLWAVTGNASYLGDGHNLIQSVINATGWSIDKREPVDSLEAVGRGRLPEWHGLGRGGIMEERCDASGTCSQDGQTFKGVFFHHLTVFCAPLDPMTVAPGVTLDVEGFQRVKTAHSDACGHYVRWVQHNALAAMATRDSKGVFGMWWGAGSFGGMLVSQTDDGIDHKAPNTTDYRNKGTIKNDTRGQDFHFLAEGAGRAEAEDALAYRDQMVLHPRSQTLQKPSHRNGGLDSLLPDPNDRGHGRSVETQMSGLALLRAYWELSQWAMTE